MSSTQPTVTIRIKSLESEGGETLILRTGKSISRTPYGEVFYSDLQKLGYLEAHIRSVQARMDKPNVLNQNSHKPAKRTESTGHVCPKCTYV